MSRIPETLRSAWADGLIVSCQAYPGEPLRRPEHMAAMAAAVVAGGAVGVRAQGLDDVRAVVAAVEVPVVGLVKVGNEGVFITPTLADAIAVASAGADVVAVDGTERARPDGLTLAAVVRGLREHTDALVMADCDTFGAGVAAAEAGVDFVGTTLAGYTPAREATVGPDLALVAELAAALGEVPVIAEGRFHTPAQVVAALDAGAFAVTVGTAITHPTTITSWFVDALAEPGTDVR